MFDVSACGYCTCRRSSIGTHSPHVLWGEHRIPDNLAYTFGQEEWELDIAIGPQLLLDHNEEDIEDVGGLGDL